MAAASYSFLDIVVLDEVRERFAAGDALAVLSADLGEILWANGTGAAWLGFSDIEAAIGEKPRLPATALRQIAAAPGFPHIGSDRTVGLRITSGLKSRIVTLQASAVTLPRGENALLLALPVQQGDMPQEERARRVITGFDQPGQFAALVEADGSVAAASDGFEALGIEQDTLHALVQDVRDEADRLVKKHIAGAERRVPAGIARLTDEPVRHLLLVVDEGPATAADGMEATPEAAVPEAETMADLETASTPAGSEPAAPAAVQQEMPGTQAADAAASEVPESRTVRFSWRTDAHGRFSAISPEFSEAMGEHAADVIGRTFREVSNAFGLDPEGSIARLLERRDTWSGRTVKWPLAGTNLKIPVDLAALPVYGRGRVFEGFRGFGIARLGEAEVDEEAIGMVLAPAEPAAQAPVDGEPAMATTSEEPASTEQETVATKEEADPFQGEKPALEISESSREKIIRLAEHRENGWSGSLTASERTAFREIGERLRRANESLLAKNGAKDESKPADAPQVHESDAAAFAGDTPSLEESGSETPAGQEPLEQDNTATTDHEPAAEAPQDAADGTVEWKEAGAVGTGQFESTAPQASHDAEEEEPGGAPSDTKEREEAASPDEADRAQESSVEERDDTGFPGDEDRAAVAGPHPAAENDGARPEFAEIAETEREAGNQSGAGDRRQSEAAHPQFRVVEGSTDAVQSPARDEPARPPRLAIIPSAFFEGTGERRAVGADTTLLAHLPLPILIHAGDRLHFANREFLKLTGYPDLAALEIAGGLGALFEEPSPSGEAPQKTLRLRSAHGNEQPVEAHLQSIAWEGGKALMLALRPAAPKEPTPEEAAKAAELEMRLSEMRAIVDTATDGIAVIANDGTIRSINRPAEALFGFDAEHLTGRPFTSLFAIESQRTVQEYLAALTDNGVASVLNDGRQVIGREAQGRFIPLFITIGRLPNGSGYCAVLRDITHWKRAEEELTQARAQAERASSQKSDFLARVSHEIRTPLNAIIGFSELMMDEKFGPIGNERYRDYLRDINRSGNHVLELVNDLLDISKIEAGQQEMAYEAVSLNETLAQVVAMMQPQANSERVIIRSSFASRLPEVVADLRSVRQIAINLLSNAVRYTPAGGQVIVSTAYERDGSVALRVRDTGIGMSSAELDEALKPFKQINALRRKRGDGTGLGLPLTRAMVEANRAQFSIASTPGEGTLVEVTFPPTRVLAG